MMDALLTPTLELPLQEARLRPWCFADAPALVEYANDQRVAQNLRDSFPHPYTQQDAEFYLCLMADQQRDLHLAVEVKGEAVGSVGVHFKTDVRRHSAEIGYWLGQAHWGRGLATAAVQAVSDYVFAHFEVCRLYAVVFETNRASARVLEKAGYVLEAVMRKSVVKEVRILDSLLYAKVKEY
ncbi:GNAT family N-acetyltransferase [Hymenobacter tibetensis]|uniref:GNAT family N-acetyltransferase n=1 Tax=Hymenobacter tibetensis TaxID=497967 RepID=A0ABY4CX06_9BACT|nr:GNAT family N-acetyltransferase [Hymenobacter tibetensis]UOG74800.1 GNAT family N-acetyltransferase [Hymenobacter tibetensis]